MAEDAELWAAWSAHVDSGSRAAFDELLGRYREPHRRYHGVRHLAWVVRHVVSLAATEPHVDATVTDVLVAAAFFHDAVYDAARSDNEECSARLAERVLGELGWPAEDVAVVADHVQATALHAPSDDPARAVLLDADLAVLAGEPAAYDDYTRGVRAEYDHVDDESWRTGRAAVLRRFLDAERLYSTAAARDQWEARARANLTAELATLGRDGDGAGGTGSS